MRQFLLVAAVAVLCAAFFFTRPVSVSPETVADANFIAEVHVEVADYMADLDALSHQVVDNIEPGLDGLKATILDRDAFRQELTGEFTASFTANLEPLVVQVLIRELTRQEISALAAFYRSDEGQRFLADPPDASNDPERFYAFVEGPGAPLLEHSDVLESRVRSEMENIYTSIEKMLSMKRFAKLFANPDLVAFPSEEWRTEVVETMSSLPENS